MLWPLAKTLGGNKIALAVQVRTQSGLYIQLVSRLVQLEKEKPENQLPKRKTAHDSMDEDQHETASIAPVFTQLGLGR